MPEQNLIYLFAAYTIIWIVLFGYMFFLSQQVGDLRSQLAALCRQRDRTAPGKPERDPNG